MIKRFLKRMKNLFFPKPEIIFQYNTYAQVGEDSIISFIFADKGHKSIKYLDVGTNLPNELNNTYLFYTRGYRGVCVEADKSLIPLINSVRPEDKIINMGVSMCDSLESDFYIFDVKGLNTFDVNEANERVKSDFCKLVEVAKVQLITIDKIIEENFETYPDFMSIDIEGLDYDVLNSLDFEKYPIPVVCVETCIFSDNHIRSKDFKFIELMKEKGYEVYADTYVNSIFVNKNWFYSN